MPPAPKDIIAGMKSRLVRLGPARLWLEPLLPLQWQPMVETAVGVGSACLELLERSRLRWQGVAHADGRAAALTPQTLSMLPAAFAPALLEALCVPWLSPAEEDELEALERFLRFRADYPKLECSACRQQEACGEGPSDCSHCPRPPLPPVAEAALNLYPLLAGCARELVLPWLEERLSPAERLRLGLHLALIENWQRRLALTREGLV